MGHTGKAVAGLQSPSSLASHNTHLLMLMPEVSRCLPTPAENRESDAPLFSHIQPFTGVPTLESLLPSMEVRMTREWS